MKWPGRLKLLFRMLLIKFSTEQYKKYLYSKETFQYLKKSSKRELINIIIQQQIDNKRLAGGFIKDRECLKEGK